MGTIDLCFGKQSFESLVGQMQTPTKMQFVVWLDEKLAEFKVQGFMNFGVESVPKWLKNYSKYMTKSGLSFLGEPMATSQQSGVAVSVSPAGGQSYTASDSAAPHTASPMPARPSTQKRTRHETPQSLPTKEEPPDPTPKDLIQVKTEPHEEPEDEDDDVVIVLPEDVPETTNSYAASERLYMPNYTMQQRPMKSLRPAHRFQPKNSYAAAIAARKRRHNRPFSQSQQLQHHSQELQNTQQHIQPQHIQPQHIQQHIQPQHSSVDTIPLASSSQSQSSLRLPPQTQLHERLSGRSIYAAGDYGEDEDGSGYVETDPETLADHATYPAADDEYIHFPIGVGGDDGSQAHVKSEFYETGDGDTSASFMDANASDQRLSMQGMGEQGLDQSYDDSYTEGTMEPGTSGMQESWVDHYIDNLTEPVCPVCGLLTPGKATLKRHMRRHTGEKPFSCSLCNARFTRRHHVKVHMAGRHSNDS